jgi:hypothetical protein
MTDESISDGTFFLNIPPAPPLGTAQREIEDRPPVAFLSAYSRLERALEHGAPAEIERAESGFGRARERALTRAHMLLRRSQTDCKALSRRLPGPPSRPRCRGQRPRPRAGRRRGGGRGSGGGGGGDGDGGGDPPSAQPRSLAPRPSLPPERRHVA